ncbi:hypothetical protein BJG93_22535 [Paraburkholderia sprentiae WSM5005]|uniref:FHA domain-containing protein n=1 Tax=Paraburkholderia sprentiae WSM5005 TaxID=754502 RepID=A0A1I9YPD4_9BURK|nr:hypothetical protein [Paraburkholderia sprentiae]APA88167.1 hypothetical protein BJG93_22535 [Paraburkholderia sprentiae WSM5005]
MRRATRFLASAMCAAIAATVSSAGSASTSAHAAGTDKQFEWPASFVVLGDGYPHSGDACRRLGESAATANYLDHMAMLIGCPGSRDSAAVRALVGHQRHARVVGEADGVTLISISTESAQAGSQNSHAPMKESPISASGTLPCERGNGQTKTMCKFGVVHHSDRSTTVVVYWPDGATRAIFFSVDGRVMGTAATANDRPMPGDTLTRKHAGINLISVGNERYEVEDTVLSGD